MVEIADESRTVIDRSTQIIDADSHVSEVPDLWTSRMSRKSGRAAPRVVDSPDGPKWVVGNKALWHPARFAPAGWKEPPPSFPPTIEECDPGAFDARARLDRLDEYDIYAQVLYPNILGFCSAIVVEVLGPELAYECVRVYNDYMTEWAAEDPRRLIPVSVLPWWDTSACVTEIHRCAEMGHRGVLLSVDWTKVGLPSIADPHWAPVLTAAQDTDMPVNLHVGFGSEQQRNFERMLETQMQQAASDLTTARAAMSVYVRDGALILLACAGHLAEIVTSGVCVDFPELKWVVVESGIGWWPYVAEALDWTWTNLGSTKLFPDRELPSYYMKRQVYGSFWFEHRGVSPALEMFPDNVMFETDFPHPTSLSPGPASPALAPIEHARRSLSSYSPDVVHKVLHDNAAKLYKVES